MMTLTVWRTPLLFIAALIIAGAMILAGPGMAIAQDNPMQMTPDGAGKAPNTEKSSPQMSGPDTTMVDPKSNKGSGEDPEGTKGSADEPPVEKCGMVDPGCWTNNALITFIWWIIKAPILFVQKLITGFDRIGFALPDPSGALMDKYGQVMDKVKPLVLIGMLLTGALMMIRSANHNAAHLVQSTLPKIGLAVIGLAFFPDLASLMADISNGLSESFYSDSEVTAMFGKLIKESIVDAGIGFLLVLLTPATWGLVGILALIALLPALIMILMLFIVTYLNSIFFTLLILVGPIALACYAVPGLQAVTEAWFKGVLATTVLPIIFSIEVMLLSWAGSNPRALGPDGGTLTLVICLIMLWIMVKTPGKVYHWAFNSMGGGHGGGFLAGMGMRTLLRKGMQAATGVATAGAGAAVAAGAGAGAVGAGAAGSASGAGGAGVKSVARNLAKNSHGSWGKERLKQHAAGLSFNKSLNSLNGDEGALQGIRKSGEGHLGTKNKIADLNSQVHGGEMPKEEAARQIQDLQDSQKEGNDVLANNLAAEYGGDPEDYQALIEAEQSSQENGQGSQVGAMESPRAPESAIPDSTEASEAEQLQDYTARITDTGDNPESDTPQQESREQRISGDQGGYGTGTGDSLENDIPQQESQEQRISGDQGGYNPAQSGEQNGSAGQDPGQNTQSSKPTPGEAGYSPPRHTEARMDDAQKGKAEKLGAMLGSNPDANRSYQRALQDDKKLRDQQGAIHHEAMKGNISAKDAKKAAASIQQDRENNLQAASNELGKRLHNSPHAPSLSENNPVANKDVRQILGNKFDYAYDNPEGSNASSSPAWGNYYQERVINDGDGNLDGNGAGSGQRGSRELIDQQPGIGIEHPTGGRDRYNRANENTPDWHRPE